MLLSLEPRYPIQEELVCSIHICLVLLLCFLSNSLSFHFFFFLALSKHKGIVSICNRKLGYGLSVSLSSSPMRKTKRNILEYCRKTVIYPSLRPAAPLFGLPSKRL